MVVSTPPLASSEKSHVCEGPPGPGNTAGSVSVIIIILVPGVGKSLWLIIVCEEAQNQAAKNKQQSKVFFMMKFCFLDDKGKKK
jgi:hypothetical protein